MELRGVGMELDEVRPEVGSISADDRAEEQRRLRRLQMMMNMVMQTFTHARLIPVLAGIH